ncbi:MAG: beta-propeller domain-containing protein, partial [Candidatus Calescibacterium sp.]
MRLWKLLSVFFTLTFLTLCSDGKIDNGSSQNKNDKIKPPELPADIKNFLQGPPALARAKNCENVVAYLSTLIGAQIERMKNIDANKIKRGSAYAQTEAISSGINYLLENQPSEPEFSETNVLERGIDEADIVKTDGKYIYLVDQGLIRVVSAYPPDQITTVAQISTQGAEILTLERKIYSFSGRADWYWWWWDPWFIWYGDGGYNLTSKIEQINLDGNKLSPELVLDIEGIYDSARLYKGDIFVVGTSYLKVSNYANYANSYGIKKFVLGESTDISVFLPKVRFIKFIDDGTAVLEEKPIADCENIYISSVTRGIGVIWVFVKNGDEIKRYAVLGVSGLITKPYVYMSQEALYILFSDAEWKTTEEGIWIQEPK